MNRKLVSLITALVVFGAAAYAQDLRIDFQLNVAAADPANYFTFAGPIRGLSAERDQLDATTGASRHGSTYFFMPYIMDVRGRQTLSSGLRGLFLYAVSPHRVLAGNNVNVTRAADGAITIQYAHRGTAFRIVTDTAGRLAFPRGNFSRRVIGFIQGPGPQVISSDFSTDGTAATINWARVWDASIPGGREIRAGVATRTGTITDDVGVDDAMFGWDGTLQATFDRNILKIIGGLNAVKR